MYLVLSNLHKTYLCHRPRDSLMPKIRNYKAVHGSSEHIFEWEHTSEDVRVRVTDSGDKYHTVVSLYGENRQVVPLCTSKSAGRKVAVTWMKSNPEPSL
jgi:hypothetical protein